MNYLEIVYFLLVAYCYDCWTGVYVILPVRIPQRFVLRRESTSSRITSHSKLIKRVYQTISKFHTENYFGNFIPDAKIKQVIPVCFMIYSSWVGVLEIWHGADTIGIASARLWRQRQYRTKRLWIVMILISFPDIINSLTSNGIVRLLF